MTNANNCFGEVSGFFNTEMLKKANSHTSILLELLVGHILVISKKHWTCEEMMLHFQKCWALTTPISRTRKTLGPPPKDKQPVAILCLLCKGLVSCYLIFISWQTECWHLLPPLPDSLPASSRVPQQETTSSVQENSLLTTSKSRSGTRTQDCRHKSRFNLPVDREAQIDNMTKEDVCSLLKTSGLSSPRGSMDNCVKGTLLFLPGTCRVQPSTYENL